MPPSRDSLRNLCARVTSTRTPSNIRRLLDNSDSRATNSSAKIGVSASTKSIRNKFHGLWGTRYLKTTTPRIFCRLKSDGPLHSIHHTIAEGRPERRYPRKKPSLSRKNTERRKEARPHGWSLESPLQKQPHRTITIDMSRNAARSGRRRVGPRLRTHRTESSGRRSYGYRKFVKFR